MNLIRLTLHEYRNINKNSKYLTLFYYKNTTVRKGKIYQLPKILKFGYRKEDGSEVLPRLSFKKILQGKCTEVKNNIPYTKLNKTHFNYSLNNIKDTEALKKKIRSKYLKSRPYLNKENIDNNGVAYSTIELF